MSLAPLTQAPLAIQLHTAAAFIAAASGIFVLLRTKGTPSHRLAGYAFAIAMIVTAISSFWITSLTPGRYSWIHILSIVTLISIPLGIRARRMGNIRAHAGNMIGPFIGLVIAGAFTLMPGRILHQVFFGP